ncbi:MAG: hypothetical protein KBD83_08825 [Gammaproteobacteria bacterium]|nr:hypothetical protein [Gammaproteobacteria bacterium]
MTIAQAQKWIRGFTNAASRCPDVWAGIQSIQAQVDAILERQKISS